MSSSDSNPSEKNARLVNFAYLVFLAAWSLGIVCLIAKRYYFHILLVSAGAGTVYINDFLHFYCAGQMILQGQGLHAYDPVVQKEFMDRLILPFEVAQVFYIQYVPFVFALSAPLAFLTVDQSFVAFALFSLACLIASAFLLHRYVPRFSSKWQTGVVFLGVFATLANLECLELGQLGLLLLLLCSVYYIALHAAKPGATSSGVPVDLSGGAALALSSIKPHYALFLAVPALVGKRWRLLGVACVTEALLLLLAGQSIGWNNVINYPRMVLQADTNPNYAGVHAEHMVSLRGALAYLHALPDAASLKLCLACMLAALVGLFWLWTRAPKMQNSESSAAQSANLAGLFAITIVAVLVVSPHTNLYDCVLLALPAYLLLPSISLKRIFSTPDSSRRTLSILLALYPLFSALMFVLWEYVPLVGQNPLPFFVVHLVLLIVLLRSTKRGTEYTGAPDSVTT